MNTSPRLFVQATLSPARLLLTLVLSCLAFGPSAVYGQSSHGLTPLGMAPGAPAGSYALSDVDAVNLFNGKVNIRIPVLAASGRGEAQGQMTFSWNSPASWYVREDYDAWGSPLYYAETSASMSNEGLSFGNVRVYGIQAGWLSMECYGNDAIYQKTLTRLYILEPDGTEHLMTDTATGGQALNISPCQLNGPSRGKIFVTTDGTGATFIADAPITDYLPVGNGYPYIFPSGYLMLKNGARYRIDDTSATLRDRNGNLVSWSNLNTQPQIKDSLNRQITVDNVQGSQCTAVGGSTYCQKVSYKGFGGTTRTIWLTHDQNLLPARLILPNGLYYQFHYNGYRDLIGIDLPMGGSIEYDYGAGLDGPQPNLDYWIQEAIPGTYWGGGVGPHIYRRLTERRLYKEGHVLENRQTFSKPEYIYNLTSEPQYAIGNLGYVEKKQYNATSVLLNTEKHYFYGSAEQSFALGSIFYPAWTEGREYLTQFYDPTGNLIRQSTQTWEQRAPVSWWTGTAESAPSNDPRLSQTQIRLRTARPARPVIRMMPPSPITA